LRQFKVSRCTKLDVKVEMAAKKAGTYPVMRESPGERCSFRPPPSGGAHPRVQVFTAPNCSWNAVSLAPWVKLASVPGGRGNGTVLLRIEPYSGTGTRTGSVIIADQVVEIRQSSTTENFRGRQGTARR